MSEFLNGLLQQAIQFSIWIYNLMPDLLVGTRGFCHLAIFFVVLGYRAPIETKHRKFIGACAGAFAGSNIAEFGRICNNFHSFSAAAEPPLTIIFIFVLFFVVHARGNMAKFLSSAPRAILKK